MSNPISHKTRYTLTTLCFILLFLFALFIFNKRTLEPSLSLYHSSFPANVTTTIRDYTQNPPPDNGNKKEACDLYTGTWVKDDEYPIYKPGSCPYVDEAFDCQSNGRQDSDYLRWRWQPHGCDLPRFSATDFLERLRGKSLMLVGDSMNRNQFESILCLLREGLTNKSKMYEVHGYKITKERGNYIFKFEKESALMSRGTQILLYRLMKLTRQPIDGSERILSFSILVTGGFMERLPEGTSPILLRINYYKEGDYLYPKFDADEAYRRALKTWAKWIDENAEPEKKLVFYRGYSSAHFRGGDWNSGGSCTGETEPILSGPVLETYPLKMKILEEVIRDMKVPVLLLNVTRLTNSRKDSHPARYGKKLIGGKTKSRSREDCSHWCLPGVPDAWNELIYATLISKKLF